MPNWSDPRVTAADGVLLRRWPIERIAAQERARLCYLATPYSKLIKPEQPLSRIRAIRAAITAAFWAGRFADAGLTTISPIVQADTMASMVPALDPLDAYFWEQWCRPLLHACAAVIVPPMDGWDDSDGVFHEVVTALSANKAVYLVTDGGAA